MIYAPTPDPAPHTGTRPVTYASYTYITNAVADNEVLPYWFFRCSVPARWNGKVNLPGYRTCVLFRL